MIDRFTWGETDEGALASGAARIARHLARAGARVIGFLPVDGKLEPPERLAPLVAQVAHALTGFFSEDVGIIDTWSTWPLGPAIAVGEAPPLRLQAMGPRLYELSPLPSGDATAAAMALHHGLDALPPSFAKVVVNLAGYARPGVVPPAAEPCQGLVLVATGRRTLRSSVAAVAGEIIATKRLGTILVG